jgi:hypothetical protein
MANGSIEDEFSKFEAEIAQLSAPAPTVCQGNHKGLMSFHKVAQYYENFFPHHGWAVDYNCERLIQVNRCSGAKWAVSTDGTSRYCS